MTPTERAKRSDALYYETVSVTRRVLCDMIANREADLEDARAESEHMRLKALAVAGELQEENERLKAENAKLRELVRLMVRRQAPISPCKNIPCGECPVKDECDQEDALMRELGVEMSE